MCDSFGCPATSSVDQAQIQFIFLLRFEIRSCYVA